jgi:hypothetical protein
MQLTVRITCGLYALGAIAAFAVGCSSTAGTLATSSSGAGGVSGSGGTATSGASSDGSATLCPSAEPKAGSFCVPGSVCEYGAASDPACNTVVRCGASRQWAVDKTARCPASCPEHFDDRAPGDPCSDPDVCTYREATCGCVGAIADAWTMVARDDAGPVQPSDAGPTDAGADAPVGHWQCVRPANGCPARRPLDGTQCVKSDVACDYGTCVFGVPLAERCLSNHWLSEGAQSCP